MTILRTFEEYITKKKKGEDVVTTASAIAMQVLEKQNSDFGVLQIDHEDIIFTLFQVNTEKKCHVSEWRKIDSNGLCSALEFSYLQDMQTQKWWKNVFFYENNRYNYDIEYDSLNVSDNVNSNTTSFGKLMFKVRGVIESWNCLKDCNHIYVQGDYSCNLIAFLIQDIWKCNVECVQTPTEANLVAEKHIAILDTEYLANYKINVSENDINLYFLRTKELTINIPVETNVLGSELTEGCTWQQMILQNPVEKDYIVGRFPFKTLILGLDADVYGNVFLTSVDLQNNHAIHLVNNN